MFLRLSRITPFFLCALPLLILADIRGTVTDPSGAVVTGAKIYLLGGPPRETSTGDDGKYRFKGVAKASYTLVAGAPGLTANPVTMNYTGGDATVDFKMSLAALSESVIVTAQRTELPAQAVASSVTVVTAARSDSGVASNQAKTPSAAACTPSDQATARANTRQE